MTDDERQPLNVLGAPLEPCCRDPLTGWFRDGTCRTADEDVGRHVICARVDREFLEYSARMGNDLSTPRPDLGFDGLNPGDCWCLCAARWKQALDAGAAPPVLLRATEASALEIVTIDELTAHALDLN